MNYLLNTHTFIWWLSDSPELSLDVRKIISEPKIDFFSYASYWEIAIKVSIGRLIFPIESIETELQQNGFDLLTLQSSYIIHSASLPMLHRDPFDWLLVALV